MLYKRGARVPYELLPLAPPPPPAPVAIPRPPPFVPPPPNPDPPPPPPPVPSPVYDPGEGQCTRCFPCEGLVVPDRDDGMCCATIPCWIWDTL